MDAGIIVQELRFKTARSSGAGGQHVNKVATKVIAHFDIANSAGLADDEKALLLEKLKSRVSTEGLLIINCSTSRSQHRNKDLVIKKILELIKSNLHVAKERKATRPSRQSVRKRLLSKKRQGLKKYLRRKPDLD